MSMQATGLVLSWISQLGNTTVLCLESVTSAACPNMECLPHLPVSRGKVVVKSSQNLFFHFIFYLQLIIIVLPLISLLIKGIIIF